MGRKDAGYEIWHMEVIRNVENEILVILWERGEISLVEAEFPQRRKETGSCVHSKIFGSPV